MPNGIDVARALAEAHPAARLPCPACAASVKGANLAEHLRKVHGDVAPSATTWKGTGLLPRSISLEGDALVLRHRLGLSRRAVALPCAIEVGARVGRRLDPTMTSYADDTNVASETVRVGRYLRLSGDRTITIGCEHDTGLRKRWRGWRDGGPARSVDLVVARGDLVAIEYALVARGMLTLATS